MGLLLNLCLGYETSIAKSKEDKPCRKTQIIYNVIMMVLGVEKGCLRVYDELFGIACISSGIEKV